MQFVQTPLRALGIEITFGREGLANLADRPSAPSAFFDDRWGAVRVMNLGGAEAIAAPGRFLITPSRQT